MIPEWADLCFMLANCLVACDPGIRVTFSRFRACAIVLGDPPAAMPVKIRRMMATSAPFMARLPHTWPAPYGPLVARQTPSLV